MVERRVIAVDGVVQGVGFRPYVHRLAAANNLRGFVRNEATGVLIDVEGERARVDAFCRTLVVSPPPLATIAHVRVATASPRSYDTFRIAESGLPGREPAASQVPPDVGTCAACLAELLDPRNRRFGHPFISCTDCGPRFTIVRETPYDRERTTMAAFPMCPECRHEYDDPADRRFHAEAIACWSCGPTLRVVDGVEDATGLTGTAAIAAAASAIRDGDIVALKALGGYQLACDATNHAAVSRLRERKRRAAKPLAVMVQGAEQAAEPCLVSPEEHVLLESPARPIVLLERRRRETGISGSIAPGQTTLGVMLPSTPVHHLLLAALDRPLVMTSGNRSDDPVAIDEASAFAELSSVADLFLVHDRPIAARCDDSVVRVAAGQVRQIRRSRGYAPAATALVLRTARPVLALGGHLKNTVCLAHGRRATLSAHIGNLDGPEARAAMRAAIDGLLRASYVRPEVIAHDLHPDYASTRLAVPLAEELGVARRVAVQHHHAHVAACIAEHGITKPVIGVVFDGAGLGTDGDIWGGEFLLVDGARFERCGHLANVSLPGGDACARRPWQSAAAHQAAAGIDPGRPDSVDPTEWRLVNQLLARPGRQPRTSSAGRLFDAVASMLGLCHVSRFEGEAPMAVESAADRGARRGYVAPIVSDGPWQVDVGAIVRGVADDRQAGRSVSEIAGAFHVALCDVVVAGCVRTRAATGCDTVVLTGGVFVNSLLLGLAQEALSAHGFRVLIPHAVPCNDGGLSLGQAYVAARALDQEGPCA